MASHLRLAASGQAQLAFIVGDAGDGKSALAWEFAGRAQQALPDLLILNAACSSLTGSGTAGLPFGDLLNQLLDTSPGWPNAGRQQELIQRLHPSVAAFLAREGYPLVSQFNLGHLLGLPAPSANDPAASGPRRICRPLTELLETVSRQSPLLLLMEDLHWADELTTETLFYLCRHLPHGRLLILATYRENEVSGSPHPQHALTAAALDEIKRRCGDVCIDLSDQPEVRLKALMDAQIDREPNSLDQEFRSRLFALTRGKPLFVSELIEDLRRQGRYIWNESGSWELARPARWQPLPAAVAAVLSRQFARLDDELRLYLTIAAVHRGPFSSQMIAAAAGADPAHVASRLAQEIASRQPLIRLDAERLYQGRMTWHYQFINDLQPLYLRQLIPPGERRMLLAQGRAAAEAAAADEAAFLDFYFPPDQGDIDRPALPGPAAD